MISQGKGAVHCPIVASAPVTTGEGENRLGDVGFSKSRQLNSRRAATTEEMTAAAIDCRRRMASSGHGVASAAVCETTTSTATSGAMASSALRSEERFPEGLVGSSRARPVEATPS